MIPKEIRPMNPRRPVNEMTRRELSEEGEALHNLFATSNSSITFRDAERFQEVKEALSAIYSAIWSAEEIEKDRQEEKAWGKFRRGMKSARNTGPP